MSGEVDIYEDLAKLIIQIAPADSRLIIYAFIVQAEGTEEVGAVYRHEFDYVNQNGALNWFDVESSVIARLTSLALQVRTEIANKTKDSWKIMKFYVDLEKASFKAEFTY